jgi:hypothetical protein
VQRSDVPHFPLANGSRRARRIQFVTGMLASVKADKKTVKASLQAVSETGGRVTLVVKLQHTSLVEVAFQTSFGKVLGLAEMLKPNKSDGAWIQAFRFVALGDDDYENLCSLINQATLQ